MNLRPIRFVCLQLIVFAALLFSGCAAPSNKGQQIATYEEEFNDPFEDTNRKIFEFNQFVDRNAIVPAAKAYRTTLPEPVREFITRFPVQFA